jgi:hypothetical protein
LFSYYSALMIGAACLVSGFLFPAAAKRGRRGSVLGMFNSHEVKVLNQPDGGEGK